MTTNGFESIKHKLNSGTPVEVAFAAKCPVKGNPIVVYRYKKEKNGTFSATSHLIDQVSQIAYLANNVYLISDEEAVYAIHTPRTQKEDIFLAITDSTNAPMVGCELNCLELDFDPYISPQLFKVTTSPVIKIEKHFTNFFRVDTSDNKIYYGIVL